MRPYARPTQILKQTRKPVQSAHRTLHGRSDVERSRVSLKRLRSITEKEETCVLGAPPLRNPLLFISTSIIFFMGVHHGSESGTEFEKKGERGGPVAL